MRSKSRLEVGGHMVGAQSDLFDTLLRIDTVCFELTNRCPLTCSHCSANAGPGRNTLLSFDMYRRLIDAAMGRGCIEIVLAGGEPLSIENCIEYVEYAYRSGALVTAFTSGITFNHGAPASISPREFQDYREAGLGRAVFSVYADHATAHEQITQIQGSFKKTIKSITNAKSVGLDCEINFVPMRPNWAFLDGVVKLGVQLGISKVNCLKFVPQGRGLINQQLLQLDDEMEFQFLNSATKIIQASSNGLLRLGGSFEDVAPWAIDNQTMQKRSLYVTTTGEVIPSADRRVTVTA